MYEDSHIIIRLGEFGIDIFIVLRHLHDIGIKIV